MSTFVDTAMNPKDDNESILKELDELMSYIDEDPAEQQEMIDPSFFIGNIQKEPADEVPTLTSVAEENPKPTLADQNQEPKQPGLFSSRVEQIKQAQEAEAKIKKEAEEFEKILDALVAENLPKIEAQLREKIRAQLLSKK